MTENITINSNDIKDDDSLDICLFNNLCLLQFISCHHTGYYLTLAVKPGVEYQ